jgi:sacsin
LLIDRTIDGQIFSKLHRIAHNGGTNISLLTSCLLEELMPKILPAEWQGSKAVLWNPGHQGQPSLAWMTLLWDYLKSTCADLTIFSKWPLLPATDGHLLQLVRNSNVIKDEGWSENMCSLLKKTGCFVLSSDLQIYHPGLGEYVQNATASGVLNALLTAAGDLQNLKRLFTDVSEGELRELRSFLCQSKWFSMGQIDSQQIDIMKALPIFESHGSRAFVNLSESTKWLTPDGVDDELINDSFIHTASEREYIVLENYLGIKRPSKNQFYREHIVHRLSEFASRSEVMLKVIQDLKAIIEEDSSIIKLLSEVPFILTAQGSLQRPPWYYSS